MSEYHHKNTIQKSQENIYSPELSNPTIVTNIGDMSKSINKVLMHQQKVKGNEENS